MTQNVTNPAAPPHVSIAIFAWNEERAIARCLNSLFEQTLLGELGRQGSRAEVMCVLNGCTDRTGEIAEALFERERLNHEHQGAFRCSVVKIAERGKLNAWNRFVHELSAAEAEFLVMMDADIVIRRKETLWSLISALSTEPEANVAVDRPLKDLLFKEKRSWREGVSLRAAQNTQTAEAQLCAQLYCIRAEVARKIYLPKDLSACEDGFIKALVCTDFLSHEVYPRRVRLAGGAEHTFEAYTTLPAVLRNQKRQVIGQTIVHILVDQYLKSMPQAARGRMAETLRDRDIADPGWLKRLIHEHLGKVRYFWRLYPGVIDLRLARWRKLRGREKAIGLPAAALGAGLAMVSALMAYVALRRGTTDYWPRPERAVMEDSQPQGAAR